jgi:DNA polymerase theta
MQTVLVGCAETTWVTTIAGRRRLLPGIRSPHPWESGEAQRQAINTVCQGSAADVVKGTMLCLDAALVDAGLAGAVRLVLQVHDELLFEVDSAVLPAAARVVRETMEAAAGTWRLSVPLPVKLSAGPSWGELETYTSCEMPEMVGQQQCS